MKIIGRDRRRAGAQPSILTDDGVVQTGKLLRGISVGDTLPNGAKVLQVRRDRRTPDRFVVLADTGGHHPFVTWKADGRGNTYLGHYFAINELAKAARDYEER